MQKADELDVLSLCRLFDSVDRRDIELLLNSLQARWIERQARSFFLPQHTRTEDVTVLISGLAAGESISPDGKTAVVNEFKPGDVFGDVLAGSFVPSQVSVKAVTDCSAVSFAFPKLLAPDAALPQIRAIVLRNLIAHISEKYFAMRTRLNILLGGAIRRRILLYLHLYGGCGAEAFFIPHNREEMAAYLGCERSALSRELSQMRAEGLIDFRLNRFHITSRDYWDSI